MAGEEESARERGWRRRRTGDARFGAEDLARGPGRLRAREIRGPEDVRDAGVAGARAQHAARDAADQALRAVREQAGDAQGKWDKLEQVFEDRVAKSLNRLGVLTKGEMADLSRQVRELNANMREMMRGGAKAAARRKPGRGRRNRRRRRKKAAAKA
jgi:poly(hydroxyalkanoate) granule-associated protein